MPASGRSWQTGGDVVRKIRTSGGREAAAVVYERPRPDPRKTRGGVLDLRPELSDLPHGQRPSTGDGSADMNVINYSYSDSGMPRWGYQIEVRNACWCHRPLCYDMDAVGHERYLRHVEILRHTRRVPLRQRDRRKADGRLCRALVCLTAHLQQEQGAAAGIAHHSCSALRPAGSHLQKPPDPHDERGRHETQPRPGLSQGRVPAPGKEL